MEEQGTNLISVNRLIKKWIQNIGGQIRSEVLIGKLDRNIDWVVVNGSRINTTFTVDFFGNKVQISPAIVFGAISTYVRNIQYFNRAKKKFNKIFSFLFVNNVIILNLD